MDNFNLKKYLSEGTLLKEALNKDLKVFGDDLRKFLEEKGLQVKPDIGQGNAQPLYDPIGKNEKLAALQLQDKDLHVIVNDSKVDVLEGIIKKYNLQSLKSLKQTGGWNDDPKKKAQAEGEIYMGEMGRRGKAYELVIKRFDPSSIKEALLNENAPGYDTRKFGEALPTLESVKAAYDEKDDMHDDPGDIRIDHDYYTENLKEERFDGEREMMMHIKQYRDGMIDGDDLVQAFEEIINGKVTPPGYNTRYGR